jgi:predicted transcriptional regulator with HTH domain
VEYHVFLTPRGDCEGLYVGSQTAQGFEVHELRGGSSNIAFDYRIMAKRNGFENVRLADVTKKYQEMEQQHKALRERMAQRRAK